MAQSVMTAAVGVAIYSFMSGADVGYLDFDNPRIPMVQCFAEWPLRHEAASWWDPRLWQAWKDYRLHTSEFRDDHQCPGYEREKGELCSEVGVPLHDMDRKLGIPMLDTYDFRNDTVEIYGHLFLYLAFVVWVMICVHDMALLSTTYGKWNVLDLGATKREFPCWKRLWILLGFRSWFRAVKNRGFRVGRKKFLVDRSRLLGIVLTPFYIVWMLATYGLVIVPTVTVFFIIYPIRLSRLILFFTANLCGLFSTVVTIHGIVWLFEPSARQLYAVTWPQQMLEGVPDMGGPDACICGCTYPIKRDRCLVLTLVGVGSAYKSFTLAFRCLKGLRRQNWAGLMSVLYPIPLNVYEVDWKRPDGSQIQHREDGNPVQAELAFDPFALMDEQLDSAYTTVNLVPTTIDPRFEQSLWSVDDVVEYIQGIDLHKLCAVIREKEIDGANLIGLCREDKLDSLGATEEEQQRIRDNLPLGGHLISPKQPTPAPSHTGSSLNSSTRRHAGPARAPTMDLSVQRERAKRKRHLEYIGCCGFPCRKGERGSAKDEEMSSQDSGEDDTAYTKISNGNTSGSSSNSSFYSSPKEAVPEEGTDEDRSQSLPPERVSEDVGESREKQQ